MKRKLFNLGYSASFFYLFLSFFGSSQAGIIRFFLTRNENRFLYFCAEQVVPALFRRNKNVSE